MERLKVPGSTKAAITAAVSVIRVAIPHHAGGVIFRLGEFVTIQLARCVGGVTHIATHPRACLIARR